ncbi:LOW QUALITY PROTEIN: hypothetical protein GHT06_001784 [Daphnia sinensis]|uniref:Uncharacterized protein n=1 Tax=Daphnia sinensis TaxID=1820382 RepID=A0AAD5L2M3_9CRUS|nr:LOW QUALITY PROTEIN: hypothetical protein GHT06_001784 [Daphnia sinensis]
MKQSQAVAVALSMAENRQQGGYSDPTKAFIEKSAAQLPIRNINYNVETTGVKEGNLPPGYYTRVDYNNGKSDYLRPEGLDELRKMNNYRLYMESKSKPQMEMGQAIAMPSYQFGGYSGFPDLQNIFQSQMQSPGVQPTQTVVNQPSGNFTGAIPDFSQAVKSVQQMGRTDYVQGDNNGDGVVDAKDQVDSFGNPVKTPQYNDINRIQLANPYGGVSLENALYFGARGFGEGKVGQGSLTAGLKAARIGMSGYAAGKEQNRVQDYMRDQLYKPNTNYDYGQVGQNATYLFQEGDQPNPNVKIEDNEFVKNSQTGQIQKAVGDKHEAKSGGIPVNLPPQSKILSDYTKIGAKNAKELKDKYDVTLKASDTFAKAMDKVNKKIGITELIQEEKEYSEKFEKQMKSSIDKKTKDVNLNFLAKELEDIEKEKLQLQPIQDQAFEEIFRLQEMIPKKSDGKTLLKQEGGYAPNVIEYSKKYGITPQRVMELMQEGGEMQPEQMPEQQGQEEQLMQAVVQMLEQGATPEEVMQQLLEMGVPEEMAVQIITSVVQEQPMAQEGGMAQPNPDEIIQAFAQLTQQDPQQIVTQLQEMQPEEQQQVLQQMVATLQQEQPKQMMREGGEMIKRADGSYSKRGLWDNIRANRGSGKEPTKEMLEQEKRIRQEGGYSLPMAQEGLQTINDWVAGRIVKPDYKYGDIKNTAKRFKEIADAYGVKYDTKDLTTQQGLDKIAGLIQQAGYKETPELIQDYDNQAYFRAIDKKKFVLPESEYNKWVEENKGNVINGNYYKTDKPGVYVQVEKETSTSPATASSKEDVKKATVETQQQDPQVKNRMVDKTMMANLPVNFNLPPSSLQGVYKPEVNLSRMDPYKLSAEPYLANIESQRQAATENNYNLPDVQRAAYNANMLAASQMAANDAIGKVAQGNTAAQFQTDMYNAQQADKEQLTNLGLAQQYENKMYGAINATDTDLRKYFAQNNMENRQRFMDIANLNMINAVTPNYQSTGSDVVFNNAPLNFNVSQADSEAMQNYLATEKDPAKRAAYINNYVKSVRSS